MKVKRVLIGVMMFATLLSVEAQRRNEIRVPDLDG